MEQQTPPLFVVLLMLVLKTPLICSILSHYSFNIDKYGVLTPSRDALVAGRVAQEFNQRKKRSGAFWEDRYHACAIMDKEYLIRCLRYIDLNMFRARVVTHPAEYPFCGYCEIIKPPSRYCLIDKDSLKNYCGFTRMENFLEYYKELIDASCDRSKCERDARWSESVAIGNGAFIKEIQEKLGMRVKTRAMIENGEEYILQEPHSSYSTDFLIKNDDLSVDNRLFGNVLLFKSIRYCGMTLID